MSQAIALAVSLARPVVRGMLSIAQAEAAIAVSIAHDIRTGELPPGTDLEWHIKINSHILAVNLAHLSDRADLASHAICRGIRPLVDRARPVGQVRAEAHNINADRGFVLTEQDVERALVSELYRARSRAGVASHQKPLRRPRRFHA